MGAKDARPEDSTNPAVVEPALRQRAEEQAQGMGVEDVGMLSPEAAQQLVHELRVHQIELEMQNEELRRTQEVLEASRARYFDLFDLAPVGYFTLSEQGLILEANLTATTMLGVPRGALLKQPLTRSIVPEDEDIFYLHRKRLFETGATQVCELRMARQYARVSQFWARLESIVVQDKESAAPVCRVTMSDITERKRAERAEGELAAELGERVKELNCLYGISSLVEIPGISLEEVLHGTVDLIPPTWQYPEVCCARIILDGQEYSTGNVAQSPWQQAADILVHGKPCGTIQVGYLQERPESDKGPFLKEERSLLNVIAERMGKIAERMRAQEQVFQQQQLLQTVLDSLAYPFYVVNVEDYTIEVANRAAYEGRRQGQLTCFAMSHDRDEPCEAADHPCPLEEILISKEPVVVEHVHMDKEGRRQDVEVHGFPILDSNGNVVKMIEYAVDITDRKEAHEMLVRRGTELHATLYSIGDAVLSADTQGRVVRMNALAEQLTGWTEAEAAGRSLREVFHVINEETRQPVENLVARVETNGTVVDLASPMLLIARDGTEIPIADSGAAILDPQGNVAGLVLVFRDRTEERLNQRLTESRLSLIEYASNHTLDELLTRALDETGTFVDSPIGFYHFVEPDQKNLSLQQWSTRTLEEFCQAEGKGRHYSIDQAGVWTDCVHEKRPVTHNDYGSLGHKKGMPEGHATVVREVVAPVLREERVVAILGVGNKPTDYTEEDEEIVSYLADVTWEIVRQKQAEEALRASESRWRSLTQTSPDHILTLDPDLTIQFANFASPGLTVDEVIGTPLYTLVDEPRQAEIKAILAGVLESGAPARYETVYHVPEGDDIYYESHVTASRLPGTEQALGLTVSARDITQRKLAEQALRASEAKLRALLQIASSMTLTLELGPLLELILDGLAEVVAYDSAIIYQLQGTGLVALTHRQQDAPHKFEPKTIQVADSALAQRIVADQEPLLISELQGRTGDALLAPVSNWACCGMAVPLGIRQQVAGLVIVYTSRLQTYSRQQAALLLALANQAAVGIENARLYRQAHTLAALEERQRLARDLHDAVSQTLFSANIIAEALPRLWDRDPESARRRLPELHRLTSGALAEMRMLLLELRPTALVDVQLSELLQQAVNAFSGRSQAVASLMQVGQHPLPEAVQIGLYRIAQEALNNVAKHARATDVKVRLQMVAGRVELSIRDDGQGFEPDQIPPGCMGLEILRERARAIGASLHVTSRPGHGTEVMAVWTEEFEQED